MKLNRKDLFKLIISIWILSILCINLASVIKSTNEERPTFIKIDSQLNSSWSNSPYGQPTAETPDKPKYYNFYDISSGTFKLSHYSTHDWIADAALRLLIDEDSQGEKDWKWLLEDDLELDPNWEERYGDSTPNPEAKHNAIRNYISYLFATQMPDMDPDHASNLRPHKNPISIDLRGYEGEIIADKQRGTGVWIGKSYHQLFSWYSIEMADGNYRFLPRSPYTDTSSSQKSPWYVWKMSKEAINCLTYKDKQRENKVYAKVETAACYMGIMAHFISDLAVPAHLIPEGDNYYPGNPDYHAWFEKQAAKHTLWDRTHAGPEGYHNKIDKFFEIDMNLIGKNDENIEIMRPEQAAIETATRAIEISYRTLEEEGLYIEKGNSLQESLIDTWRWGGAGIGNTGIDRNSNSDVVPGGITYKEYYDKIEKLLNYAIYYTAAALKWTIEEVKKENNNQVPDPNQWAQVPWYELYDETKVPSSKPLDQTIESKKVRQSYENAETILVVMAIGSPIFVVAYGPKIIKIVFRKKTLKNK